MEKSPIKTELVVLSGDCHNKEPIGFIYKEKIGIGISTWSLMPWYRKIWHTRFWIPVKKTKENIVQY